MMKKIVLSKKLSFSTVHRCIQKPETPTPNINSVKYSGPKPMLYGPKDNGNMFYGQKSPCFSLFSKPASLMLWACISAWVKVPSTRRHFRETGATIKTTSFARKSVDILAGLIF